MLLEPLNTSLNDLNPEHFEYFSMIPLRNIFFFFYGEGGTGVPKSIPKFLVAFADVFSFYKLLYELEVQKLWPNAS